MGIWGFCVRCKIVQWPVFFLGSGFNLRVEFPKDITDLLVSELCVIVLHHRIKLIITVHWQRINKYPTIYEMGRLMPLTSAWSQPEGLLSMKIDIVVETG